MLNQFCDKKSTLQSAKSRVLFARNYNASSLYFPLCEPNGSISNMFSRAYWNHCVFGLRKNHFLHSLWIHMIINWIWSH